MFGQRYFRVAKLRFAGLSAELATIRPEGAANVQQFFYRKARSEPPGDRLPQKMSVSKARIPPRPRGYMAKLENVEEVRRQGCPKRCGNEGYVAKRRNGQRVHG